MKEVVGDLLVLAEQGEFDVIAHGCNCMCTMGRGIALTIKRKWPEVYEADLTTVKGDRGKLGTCTSAVVERLDFKVTVVNAYTQYNYTGAKVLVEYDAVRSCLKWIKDNYAGSRIGLPLIGAGLAGGDWDLISKMIEEELAGEDVTIVHFKK